VPRNDAYLADIVGNGNFLAQSFIKQKLIISN